MSETLSLTPKILQYSLHLLAQFVCAVWKERAIKVKGKKGGSMREFIGYQSVD